MTTNSVSKTGTNYAHIKILGAQFKKFVTQGAIKVCRPESKALIEKRPARSSDFNEAQIRQSFILPFVSSLGWNTENPFEVYPEERANGGFIDIRLRTEKGDSLICEIKRASVDLNLSTQDGREAAYQGVGYARTFSNAPYCLVTNFETTHVFHSYAIPSRERIAENLVATFSWQDLLEGKADKILDALSKQSIESKVGRLFFDKAVKEKKIIRTKRPLEDRILDDLEVWRLELVSELSRGLKDPVSEIDLAVQLFINRILFIRCCEDRALESHAVVRPLLDATKLWKKLTEEVFPFFRASYNSDIFVKHSIVDRADLKVSDDVIKSLLSGTLIGTKDDIHEVYDFSIIPLEILGAAYESYLAKQVVADKSGFKLELKPEVKKAGGVCYTPGFIVGEIVRQTLETEKTTYLPKVLDPACGSGTFLIATLRHLLKVNTPVPKKKSELSKPLSLAQKKKILQTCVFGVDLDPKAVEITKLSLLLQLLEGEKENFLLKSALLPSLQVNVRCGNSLISPTEAVKHSDPSANLSQIGALDWKTFLNSIKAPNGVDAIVGNPPYVRIQVLQEFYPVQTALYSKIYPTAADGNVDLYIPFMERSLSLLKKNGRLGFIVPHRYWTNEYGKTLREMITKNKYLEKIVNFRAEQVFEKVTTYTCISVLSKRQNSDFIYVEPDFENGNLERFIDEKPLSGSNAEALKSSILKESPWLLAPKKTRDFVLALEKSPKCLREYTTSGIFQGLINGSDSVYLLKEAGGKLHSAALGDVVVDIESELIFPILKGSADLKCLRVPMPDLRLLYPYIKNASGALALIDPKTLMAKYPKASSYLQRVEKILRERSALKTKAARDADLENDPERFRSKTDRTKFEWYYTGDDYYRYSRNQALDCVLRQKLIVPSLIKEPAFYWDEKGEYALTGSGSGGGGAYAMYLHDSVVESASALVGILSSNLLRRWFERRGDLFSGYYVGLDEKTLMSAPLPDLLNPKNAEALKILSRLTKESLKLSDLNRRDQVRASIDDVVNSLYFKQ